ncbi:MAG: cytochrome c oxidase subunit II [Magnetovibrio sp.]|nr:cytochrome c oxidase subunit II [Magnetovibrio sp.]
MFKRLIIKTSVVWLGLLAVGPVLAEEYVARSKPWQMWLQEPMSPSAEKINDLNVLLLWIEVGIVVFVLALLAYCIIRFREKRNPTPTKTTHNTALEVAWTAIPVLILVAIAVPSLKVLYYTDQTPNAEMTLKVAGNQWYWTYIYPDHGDLEFDSNPIPDDELKPGQPRLLSVDNPVYLPANTNIRLLLSSNDVIHNWAIPSLAVKLDNTPGRVNETWVRINKPGSYYGMCSELCGVYHSFMPIHIKALSRENFKKWVVKAKLEFAANSRSDETLRVAQVEIR